MARCGGAAAPVAHARAVAYSVSAIDGPLAHPPSGPRVPFRAPMTSYSPHPSSRAVLVGAAVVFVLALVARVADIGALLPHLGEPDAYIVRQTEALMEDGLGDRHFAGWKYPHFIATAAAVTAPLDVRAAAAPSDAVLEDHLAAAAPLQRHVRIVVAVVASLVAPATFSVALRFFAFRWALLAGVFAAASLLHLSYSWQARPHGAVAGTAMLAVLACVRLAERPGTGRALFAGLACAASTATLHFGAAVLASLVAAAVIAIARSPGKRGRATVGALLAAVVVLASTVWFYDRADDGYGVEKNPESFRIPDPGADGDGVEGGLDFSSIRLSGHPIPLDAFDGAGIAVAWEAFWSHDPAQTMLALVGAFVCALALVRWRALRADPRRLAAVLCVAAFALPTFAVLAGYSLSFARFFAVLVGPFALLAATGARVLGRSRIGRVAMGILVGLALLPAAKFAWLRSRSDTLTRAAEVLEGEGWAESPFHTTNLNTLPMLVRRDLLVEDRRWSGKPWDRYLLDAPEIDGSVALIGSTYAELAQMLGTDDPAAVARHILDEREPETVLVSLADMRGREAVASRWDAMRDAWLDVLESGGFELVHKVAAGAEDEPLPVMHGGSALRVMKARRLGPSIGIYRRQR